MTILSARSARRGSRRPRRDGGRGSPASPGRRRTVRWPAPRRRLDAAPTGCRPMSSPHSRSVGGQDVQPGVGVGRCDLADGVAERVEPPVEDQRRQPRAVNDGFGGGHRRQHRAVHQAVVGQQPVPSVNGADADGSIGMPTLAERTAATMQPLCRAGATEANEASPHNGAALRHRRATTPSKNPTPQPSAFIRPCFWRRGAYDCTSSPYGGSSTSDDTERGSPSQPRCRHI